MGEKIEMENYEKTTEEEKNKALMLGMWTILIVSMIAFFGAIVVAGLFTEEGPLQLIIILGATILFLIPCFIALKLELKAGYYECKNCHHKFIPTYNQAVHAMHMGTTRYLKCPECGERTWCKKVIKK